MSDDTRIFDGFAAAEYRDLATYTELARIETVPEFKAILEQLVQHEQDDYQYWIQFSSRKNHSISVVELIWIRMMRRVLGLTFTAKFLERRETEAVRSYSAFLQNAGEDLRERLQKILEREEGHEQVLIGQIREEKVQFISSIVLGLNDALIELTGALVGFAIAFHHGSTVLLTGMITAIAASLSMASSAYMQARHEEGKNPRKAAFYTGISYITVGALLLLPFGLLPNVYYALAAMALTILAIIAGMSYYSAVLFDRDFSEQFTAIVVSSLGVAAITFVLGSALRRWIPGRIN